MKYYDTAIKALWLTAALELIQMSGVQGMISGGENAILPASVGKAAVEFSTIFVALLLVDESGMLF